MALHGRSVCTALAVLSVASVALANPYFVVVVNEFSTDTAAGQWIELHRTPDGSFVDLTGWRIVTNTSECTLDLFLDSTDYFILDQDEIARREYVRGAFALNTETDSIRVYDDRNEPHQAITYPRLPAQWNRISAPDPGRSACLWNQNDSFTGGFNLYIDSTPTPGSANDDWSSMSGTVTVVGGEVLGLGVRVNGIAGNNVGTPVRETGGDYTITGLGPGKYKVIAEGTGPNGWVYRRFPDSVEVGYSSTTAGINFVFDFIGIAETPGPRRAEAQRPTVLTRAQLQAELQQDPSLTLFDASGREALRPKSIPPGIYFVRGKSSRVQGSEGSRRVVITD